MTSSERRGIADALRAALPYLWDGQWPSRHGKKQFICHALDASCHPDASQTKAVIETRVMTRNGFTTMEAWLNEEAGVDQDYLTATAVQAHRHAWMLELIKEFES